MYPFDCASADNDHKESCIRGNIKGNEIFDIIKSFITVGTITIVTACLGSIVVSKFRSANIAAMSIRRVGSNREAQLHQNEAELRKTLIQQSLMYETVFLLVWMFLPLKAFLRENDVVAALTNTFVPLQGFFNACIYFYHRVRMIQKSNDQNAVPVFRALYYIFFTPVVANEMEVTGLSNISRLRIITGGNVININEDDGEDELEIDTQETGRIIREADDGSHQEIKSLPSSAILPDLTPLKIKAMAGAQQEDDQGAAAVESLSINSSTCKGVIGLTQDHVVRRKTKVEDWLESSIASMKSFNLSDWNIRNDDDGDGDSLMLNKDEEDLTSFTSNHRMNTTSLNSNEDIIDRP